MTLTPFCEEDMDGLYTVFRAMIEEGTNFPHNDSSREEFRRSFFAIGSTVFVCKLEEEILGGFYIRPNFPGRACHIANAGYMLKKEARGKGFGRLLCETSLRFAKELGFRAMQYNLVLSQNLPAINLYEKLGFQIIGTIAQAVRNDDGSFQKGYIMYRSLEQGF